MATVCFTGHRAKALAGYKHDAYVNFVEQLKAIVLELTKEKNVNRFITGGAQGMDQLAFWAVDAVVSGRYDNKKRPEIKNAIYEPFENYGEKWAEKGLFSKKEYSLAKKRASEVKTLNKAPEGSYVVKLLNERNHAMVDDSDILIALYNNDSNWRLKSTKSGTAECMRYASSKGKPILQIGYCLDENGNLAVTGTNWV